MIANKLEMGTFTAIIDTLMIFKTSVHKDQSTEDQLTILKENAIKKYAQMWEKLHVLSHSALP